MTISTINVGILANDGTGDDLREAFIKVNNNFTELDARQAENTTAVNKLPDGSGAYGIFAQKVGDQLQFKNLKTGNGITLFADGDAITINSTGSVNQTFITDQGSASLLQNEVVRFNGTGATFISRNEVAGVENLYFNSLLSRETSPSLSANLDADGNNIINVETLSANNVDSLVKGKDITDLDSLVGFDFGNLSGGTRNILQWLEAFNPVNMGTITAPASTGIDMGTI
jgi:hypothetical protein